MNNAYLKHGWLQCNYHYTMTTSAVSPPPFKTKT